MAQRGDDVSEEDARAEIETWTKEELIAEYGAAKPAVDEPVE